MTWTVRRPAAWTDLFVRVARIRKSSAMGCWCALALSACGGGAGGGQPPSYTVGGAVSGLAAGTSVILSNGDHGSVTVSVNSAFSFPTSLPSGSSYVVTVRTQPQGAMCSIANGSGTIANANITDIAVTCDPAYTVGGTVEGLIPGGTVTLLNNGGDSTTISSNTTFTFPTGLPEAAAYSISVGTQPAGQVCTVNYPTGAINLSVTNVLVECASEAVLWSFGGGTDGVNPWGGLLFGSDGALYGTTTSGGTFGQGAVYRVTLDGHETVLWNFGAGADGTNPYGALVVGGDGNFYGTTYGGGTNGKGTVFSLTPTGTETVLWNFGAGNDGANPRAGLTLGSDGSFYGTTQNGGAAGYGTVFRITPNGTEAVLWSFWTTVGDSQAPWAPLIQASDGNFYGTTSYGGLADWGTAFRITSAGVETVLWSFIPSADLPSDGFGPVAPLVEGSDGYLYGTTYDGGNGGYGRQGAVVRLAKAGPDVVGPGSEERVWWSFGASGASDGGSPQAGLIIGRDGNFYGTTSSGGAYDYGTVFKITPSGLESVLWSFGSGADALNLQAPLLQGADGSFYGVSVTGGANGKGTVFKVTQ